MSSDDASLIPIVDTQALADFCERVSQASHVAVDCEFMRENTYYSDLCLIQVAASEHAAIIDPKAPGLSMEPLFRLLNESPVLKVVHAGSQDFEIFYNLTGRTPTPAFDTQIAAMALGLGEQIGYQGLVEKLLGISVEKGARFTDWSRRPLDERQLRYAIGDVTHLAALFPKMLDRLLKRGRGEWLDDEMNRLMDAETYRVDPDQVWRRIKLPSRKLDVLGRLKALAAWREREAQRRDLPRGRLMKDEALAELAANPPKNQDKLGQVRGIPSSWSSNEIGRHVLDVLAAAPPLDRGEVDDNARGSSGGKRNAQVADLLKLLLKIRCDEEDVAARLICRTSDLDALAAGEREGLAILSGWRYDLFGRDAVDLVEGRLAFSVRNGQTSMARLDGSETQGPEASSG